MQVVQYSLFFFLFLSEKHLSLLCVHIGLMD